MQNAYLGWIIGVAVIVLVGGGIWLATKNYSASPTATTTPEAQTPTSAKPSGGTGGVTKPFVPAPVEKVYASGLMSISELVRLTNVSYSCTFVVVSPYRAGKFDLAGKKWRGDFTNDVSMIDDGAYIYVWAKGATEGLKVVANSSVVGNAIVKQGGIDAFTPITYKCNLGSPDASRFVPPSNVIFKNTEGYLYQ